MADARGRDKRSLILILLLALAPFGAGAQTNDAVRALAQREKQPLLDTLKALVEIESGTDAAFAALETKAPVIEGMGLRNFGAHTNNAEYVNISSIEPRLYLLTRLIMDIAAGRAGVPAPAVR